jgi:hypothetical protein
MSAVEAEWVAVMAVDIYITCCGPIDNITWSEQSLGPLWKLDIEFYLVEGLTSIVANEWYNYPGISELFLDICKILSASVYMRYRLA